MRKFKYRQLSNIRRTFVGNWIVDHSDVVGASPVGAASTTSSFSTQHMASIYSAKTFAIRDKEHLSWGIWCVIYHRLCGNNDQLRPFRNHILPSTILDTCYDCYCWAILDFIWRSFSLREFVHSVGRSSDPTLARAWLERYSRVASLHLNCCFIE